MKKSGKGVFVRHGIFFIVLCCLFSSNVFGQYTNLKFENISTSQGLSSSTCTDLYQDQLGFLWVATIDGLNQYDGYGFKVFRPVPDDNSSISNNRINSIAEDKLGRLWIGTANGLNVFDKGTGKFHRFFHDNSSGSISDNFINHLFYDHDSDVLWVATKNGLNSLDLGMASSGEDPFSIEINRFFHSASNQKTIDHNNATRIIKDREGIIWIATAGVSLNRYDQHTNAFERVPIAVPKPFELNHLPKLLLEDEDGNFWIGNDLSRLAFWDRKVNAFLLKSFSRNPTPIFDLYKDRKGNLWIATDGDGLYIKYKDNDDVQHIRSNPYVPYALSNNQPSKILEDRNGIIWIASYNTGINKLTRSASAFGLYFHQEDNAKSLSKSIAQSIFQDSRKRIWVGSDGGGLNLLNDDNKTFTHYRASPNDLNTISSDKILYFTENYRQELVVCTWDGGFNLFNPETKRVKRFLHNPNDPQSLGNNTVWCAVEDNAHRLWLGTQTSGLNYFDYASEAFYKFVNVENDTTSLVGNTVIMVFIDSRNRLLVGTTSGFSWTDLTALPETFPKQLVFNTNKSLKGVRINHIAEDHNGNIWIGSDVGLFKLKPSLDVELTLTTQHGLPNALITGIVEDDGGNIWITSKGGLSKLDPAKNHFTNFNTSDGIQGLEFQGKSIEKTTDGSILIGGINGFNVFDPAKILADLPSPYLMLSGLRIANEPVAVNQAIGGRTVLVEPIEKTTSITLNYTQNYLSFDYLALNYSNPQKTEYAYRMTGLDNDWNYVGKQRNATYSNLTSGTYKFEVMASTNGKWEEEKAVAVSIGILPAPWKTWWAYVIYVLIIGLVFIYSMRYYTKRVREEKEHELDQAKLSFFINVSHEFRTPLTLILNPIDKILSSYKDPEEVKASALTIQRSGRRLLNLVNQLLDLRKTDLGKSPLELVNGNFVEFAKDLFNLFTDFAKMKNVEFVFESSVNKLDTYFDPDKIEKILTNLLSNAIKFTNPGGRVTLSIGRTKLYRNPGFGKFFATKTGEVIEISVRDTGIGLTPEQITHIFERFFHVDNSKSGTGIGLHFTKSLVELHEGQITVESEYGKGTTFTIQLPIYNKRYKDSKKDASDILNKYSYDTTSIRAIEYDLAVANNHEENTVPGAEAFNSGTDRKPVLLIVEDNRELRLHLRNELKGDFRVKEAVDGADGLEKILKIFPDIIISDIMMPRMDGFELCRRLKTDIDTSHIPMVLLTARVVEEDKIEGYLTGADEYLPKPFNINVLRARLKNLLDSRRRLKEKFLNSGVILPAKEVTTNTLDEVFLDKVTKVILDNISDPDFSLDKLFEQVGISRSHFFRKINSLTGQNPSNFIRTVRLKYASELLIRSQHSIKEISFMAGFNSSAYFSKTFRELFGKTPQQFIEDHQEKHFPNLRVEVLGKDSDQA